MNATIIVATVSALLSTISLLYTMGKDKMKKETIDASEKARMSASLESRADIVEMAKLSAKIDVLTAMCADTQKKVERIDERERDNDKRIAVIEKQIEEDRR